jgi:hypothetical protein
MSLQATKAIDTTTKTVGTKDIPWAELAPGIEDAHSMNGFYRAALEARGIAYPAAVLP